MALKGKTNEEKIWNFLQNAINNKYGTAGLMGNLYAESGLRSNNLQNTSEKKLNMTDEEYTSKVNSGQYSNFIKDSAGYGLAQWTFWTRKQELLKYARSKNVSIDDLEMQLEFLIKELKTYKKVWETLQTAKSVFEASNKVLIDFEAPKTKNSEATQKSRESYGQNYFNKYGESEQEKNNQEINDIYELSSKSAFSKYLLSTTGHYISNSGGDERGKISGGQAGDQTGKEWQMRYWYNRPWTCILRYPDFKVALKIAELGCKSANNNKIGYDQNQRSTYWTQLQKVGYDPSKIKTACEADCSAGVIANTKAVGYLLNISKLKDISATYTGNMKNAYSKAGFQVLTSSQYIASPDYLLPGDILLNENHHTATNITLGKKAKKGSPTIDDKEKVLQYGSSGEAVKTMQKMLIACGYSCGSAGADGDFGSATLKAVRKFQTDQKLVIDGIYGPTSKKALEALYKEKTSKPDVFKNFSVKVTTKSLNIREKPSISSKIVGKITDQGTYVIEDVSGTWGKLKTGEGWISLNYTKKINK